MKIVALSHGRSRLKAFSNAISTLPSKSRIFYLDICPVEDELLMLQPNLVTVLDHHHKAVTDLQALINRGEISNVKIHSTTDTNQCALTLLGLKIPKIYSMVSKTIGIDLQELLLFVEVIRYKDVKAIVNEDQRSLITEKEKLYHSWFSYARMELFKNGLLKAEHLISLLKSPEKCFKDSQLFDVECEQYTEAVKKMVESIVKGGANRDLSMRTICNKNVTILFLKTGSLLKMWPFLEWLKQTYPHQKFLCCFWLQHLTQLTPDGKCELHFALRRTSNFIDLTTLPKKKLGLTGGGHKAAAGAQFLLYVDQETLSSEFISGDKPSKVDQAFIREAAKQPLHELVESIAVDLEKMLL